MPVITPCCDLRESIPNLHKQSHRFQKEISIQWRKYSPVGPFSAEFTTKFQ